MSAGPDERARHLARRVAHDIQTPAVAVEMMLPRLAESPESARRILTAAVEELKRIARDLRERPEKFLD